MTALSKLKKAEQAYQQGLAHWNDGLIADWELCNLESELASARLDVLAQ